MKVTLVNFNTVNLDFSTNYFVQLQFTFKETTYIFQVLKNNDDELMLYCKDNFIIKNPKPNTFYKAKDFNIAFVVDNFLNLGLVDDKDFSTGTIFNKYKLGLFYA